MDTKPPATNGLQVKWGRLQIVATGAWTMAVLLAVAILLFVALVVVPFAPKRARSAPVKLGSTLATAPVAVLLSGVAWHCVEPR